MANHSSGRSRSFVFLVEFYADDHQVEENLLLMDQIQQVLSNDLLESDPFKHASRSDGPAMFQAQLHHEDSSHTEHPTNLALQPPSSVGRNQPPASNQQRSDHFLPGFSLSDQVLRSGNNPNLSVSSDIFMQDQSVIQPNSLISSHAPQENLSFTLETGASTPIGSIPAPPAINWRSEMNFRDSQHPVNQSQGMMVSQANQYRSWSGAAASSRDSSARSSVSPEQALQQQIHANSSPKSHFSAKDRLSSVSQLYSQQASPYTTPTNTRSPSPAQYNESAAMPAPGRQNNSLQFQVWQRDGSSGSSDPTLQMKSGDGPSNTPTHVKRSGNARIMNQASKVAGPLLLRQSLPALKVLKEADSSYQKAEGAAEADDSNGTYDLNVNQLCEYLMPSHVQIMNSPNFRSRQRSVGVEHPGMSGQVHACHNEAAINHMLAERRRRVKQKENFTALRRLVPIISKADKASTLIDAITYLKHLQSQIQEMETSKEDIDHRCQSLESRCKQLEERNQELVELISKDPPTGVNHLKLHSTKSI